MLDRLYSTPSIVLDLLVVALILTLYAITY